MIVKLSGIAAKEIGKTEFQYEGKLTKKELLFTLINAYPSLRNIKLEIAVNSERIETEDSIFSKKDEVLLFNAYAGG